jgi:uncharacterized protein YdaL
MTTSQIFSRSIAVLAVAASVAACGPNQTSRQGGAGRTSSEHAPGVANAFPSDHGPVPVVSALRSAPATAGPEVRSAPPPPPSPNAGTLIVYDDTGPYAWLGELYGVAAANLASRFGAWTARPVAQYQAGDIAAHRATIYIGSTYDQALPAAFLDDVAADIRPVIWMYNNIWQLAGRVPNFAGEYGFVPWRYDTSPVAQVDYKGHALGRYQENGGSIMEHSPFDPTRAAVLATAVRADGTTLPWAVRARNLTYIGEIPFAYIGGEDRYLAFCDLLFDALEPDAAERHRALVRIEDVSADTDPVQLAAIGQLLASEGIPFSIALIPLNVDPLGVYSEDGAPSALSLVDRPELLEVLQSLAAQGATIVMHGYTHQYRDIPNPYSGASADDFEFFRAHVDANNYVIYDGPVEEDPATWANERIDAGLVELGTAGFSQPAIFEYPHYAGSAADSRALARRFGTVYHRGLYFGGALGGGPDDPSRMLGQFFPYPVTDVFGWRVIPENLGNYEPEPFNNHPARLVPDLLRAAEANLVVRDGVASFYFHPYNDVSVLRDLVQGIRLQGYTFVGPHAL